MIVNVSDNQEQENRRGGTPEGVQPRRLTFQRTPRQCRIVLQLVIRQVHWRVDIKCITTLPVLWLYAATRQKAIGRSGLHGSFHTRSGLAPTQRGINATGRLGEPKAWGNSYAGVAQCAKAGLPTNGFLLPHPTAGGAASAVITADLVSAPAVLMTIFTASSIGSLKGTSIRSSPCS